ncbi:hypothetical protein SAMN05216338_102436 [Bradyrhizobium sp. Rc2d]|uniref:hypothetical protein n=1 Tax=Bradyrhizobium sp. Rc2d TaxID=1855321 RepID=UPI00088053F7|nr:hypothetical protein [Bradyrhizobium sp. Rc2d]SDI50949.1 hypothetical protein SAMN05216338_102436 [Bradyrhizobium sp. Rc2d]
MQKALNRSRSIGPLFVVPAIYVFFESVKTVSLKGSFGEFVDPDAAYYIACVNLLAGNNLHFVLHPGIGIIYFGAAVLAIAKAALYPGWLGAQALLHFDELAQIIRLSLVLAVAAATIGAGLIVLRGTRDRGSGIALQLGLFATAAALTYGGRIMPESLLIAIAIVLVAVTYSAVRGEFTRRRFDVAAGVLVGIGLSTKVLFAPFLLLYPIAAGLRSRAQTTYWICVLLSLTLLVWPLHSELAVFGTYMKDIVRHRGPYGSGLPGFLDFDAAAVALTNLARDYGIQISAAFISFVVAFTFRRSDQGAFRILLAVTVVLCGSIAMIAKQYTAYYLVPGLAMVPFMVALAFTRAPISSKFGFVAWRFCAAVLILGCVAGPAKQAWGWYKGALSQNADERRVVSGLAKLQAACFLAPSYSVGMYNYPIVFGFLYGARLDDQVAFFDAALKEAFGGMFPNYEYFEQKVFRPGAMVDFNEFVGPDACAAVVSSYPLNRDSAVFRERATDLCKVGRLNILLIRRTCEEVDLPKSEVQTQVQGQ